MAKTGPVGGTRASLDLSTSVTTDAAGLGIIRASVLLTDAQRGDPFPTAPVRREVRFTINGVDELPTPLDDSGEAQHEFTGLAPGTYSIVALILGSGLRESKSEKIEAPSAVRLTTPLAGLQSFDAHNYEGRPGLPIIGGTVRPAQGGHLVRIYDETDPTRGPWETKTDANGCFRFPERGTASNPLRHTDFHSFLVEVPACPSGSNLERVGSFPPKPKRSWTGNVLAGLYILGVGCFFIFWVWMLISAPFISYDDTYERYQRASKQEQQDIVHVRERKGITPSIPVPDMKGQNHFWWLIFDTILLVVLVLLIVPVLILAFWDEAKWVWYKAQTTVRANRRGASVSTGATLPATDQQPRHSELWDTFRLFVIEIAGEAAGKKLGL